MAEASINILHQQPCTKKNGYLVDTTTSYLHMAFLRTKHPTHKNRYYQCMMMMGAIDAIHQECIIPRALFNWSVVTY